PTGTDACDASVAITSVDTTTQGACPGTYSIKRTWRGTDDCGNVSAPVSQTITVIDNTAPVISGQGIDLTIYCIASPLFTPPTATDACDATPTITFVDTTTQGNCPQSYSVKRTWRATDDCGNVSAPVSQTITVIDNVPPVLSNTCIPCVNATISCPNTPVFRAPTAADDCDPNPIISSVDTTTPGACPGTYTIKRTWRATDHCGNVSMPLSHTYTVVDNTAPVLVGQSGNATASCGQIPTFIAPVAVDACDASPDLVSVDTTIQGACPGTYSMKRTWRATDNCGNVSVPLSQTVNVVDNLPPTILGQFGSSTISCPAVPSFATAGVTDACDPNPTLTYTDTTTQGACAGTYSIKRTWRAIDACGNQSQVSHTISVVDVTAPVMDGSDCRDTVIYCPSTPVFTTAPTASDICDAIVPVVVLSNDTTQNLDGSTTYTRTWSATDDCGNTSSYKQKITFIPCNGSRLGGNADITSLSAY
ncbi:MAG: hypothetical protein V4615_17935, partial [Bacteroidota bacterium]